MTSDEMKMEIDRDVLLRSGGAWKPPEREADIPVPSTPLALYERLVDIVESTGFREAQIERVGAEIMAFTSRYKLARQAVVDQLAQAESEIEASIQNLSTPVPPNREQWSCMNGEGK